MKLSCSCTHVGVCPYQEDPLKITYPDGTPVYRALTPEEDAESLIARMSEESDEPEFLHEPPEGAFLLESEDELRLGAIALDPERAQVFAESQAGRKCKAQSAQWARTHKAPLSTSVAPAGTASS